MNMRAGFGLCAAFFLGVAAGHFAHRDEAAAPVALPVLRTSAAALRGCDRPSDETYAKNEATARSADASAPRIEDPASAFTAALALPDTDTKLAAIVNAFTRWLLSAPV